MIPINDTLKKHVPFHICEQISNKFPNDPSPLLDGVNYTYKGKTWNFRIAHEKISEVYTKVFLCIYSTEEIQGYWFFAADHPMGRISIHSPSTKRPSVLCNKGTCTLFHCGHIHHSQSKQEKHTLYDLYQHTEGGTLFNGEKTEGKVFPLEEQEDKVAKGLLEPIVDFLKGSQKADDSTAPKMPAWVEDDAKLQEFFKSCPHLINPQAKKTTAPNKDRKERSYSYGAAFCGILLLLALSYKVGHYVKDKWFSEPKPQLNIEPT